MDAHRFLQIFFNYFKSSSDHKPVDSVFIPSPSLESGAHEQTAFGKEMLKHFLFDKDYKNLNHGSFGTYPIAVRNKMRELQDQEEAQPELYMRYRRPVLLKESREAIAQILNIPASSVVFVPNSTTGVNTVLRNLRWSSDGKDEIIFFNTVYGACGNTVESVCEASNDIVKPRKIDLHMPIENSSVLTLFRNSIRTSRESGCRPRIAIIDTISSMPGVRMPFEDLVEICRQEGILSLVDGAHGIGQIDLNVLSFDPDFLVTSCHKWLFTPRGCAVLYVPKRHQATLRSTLPTSLGYISRPGRMKMRNPLPRMAKSDFIAKFDYVGTVDIAPYLCVPAAIKWRKDVCGGEAAIRKYCRNLAFDGGNMIAAMLGTHILDNDAQTLTDCCMVNVLLPIGDASGTNKYPYSIEPENGECAAEWMSKTLANEFKAFIVIYFFEGQWWARLSGQVYLDMSDFEWAGEVLKTLCKRVGKGEYLPSGRKGVSLTKVHIDPNGHNSSQQ